MTALTDEITWPDQALEPALIGDALYDDVLAADQDSLGMEHGALFWEGSARGPFRLCGTDHSGDIALAAAELARDEPPWFSDEDWELPPSADTAWARSVSAVIQDIFGELGLASAPGGLRPRPDIDPDDPLIQSLRDVSSEPEMPTLDDVAGLFGPDWTGGMDSVTWVRAQRDDDPGQWTTPIILTEEDDTHDRG